MLCSNQLSYAAHVGRARILEDMRLGVKRVCETFVLDRAFGERAGAIGDGLERGESQ